MKSTMSLQLDTDTILRLISHLKVRGGTQDVSAVVNSAIELWLREQSRLTKGSDPASVRGYQWKTLFLPDGTELRSWSYGEHNYARVVGDEIIHNGKAVSPNQFAQSFACSTRNAWTDLYIRRPQDPQFKLAHRLRLEQAHAEEQTAAAGAAAALADASIGTLLAAMQSRLQTTQPLPQAAPPQPRDTTPNTGWNLPERRKFRFRLEDVAFE